MAQIKAAATMIPNTSFTRLAEGGFCAHCDMRNSQMGFK